MPVLTHFSRLSDRLFDRFGHLRRIVQAIVLLCIITILGSVGYILITDMNPLDALFMTVITLSTVGYEEVIPLDTGGKIFSILLIGSGVGVTFYCVAAVTEFIIEGSLHDILGRRAMEQRIARMTDHIVLCGYGRFGQVIAEELLRGKRDIVIIESDPDKEIELIKLGHPYIIGSGLDDEALGNAGIERASTIILAMESDSDNVFASLSAKEVNPEIKIHARGETEAGIRRLRLAGASQVISPYQIGGMRIANAILRPSVVDFLTLTAPGSEGEMDLEEIVVKEASALNGLTLRELPGRNIRVSVVAIKRGESPIQLNPGPDHRIFSGDRVVIVGDRDNLRRLEELF
jgi:voltage-gated potassium channel